MIQGNEMVMLCLGIGGLIFLWRNRHRVNQLPSGKILIIGFCILLMGWLMTVLEGFFWPTSLNYIEHICYAVSAIYVMLWTLAIFKQEEND
jgi:hypothetical protein